MTPDQAVELGIFLKNRREQAGVAMYGLATKLGVDRSQLTRLEQGSVRNPRPEILAAYAEAIGVPAADIFTMAHMPLAKGLPTLRPYLRAKYRDLTAEDAAQVEAFVDDLMRKHGNGPQDGEDER